MNRTKKSDDLSFVDATPDAAAEIASLLTAATERLVRDFGPGHWSMAPTEKDVLLAIKSSRFVVARRRGEIVAVFRLGTKKPWAIDVKYFTPCTTPLYLTGMAVDPSVQRKGIGRRCLDEAKAIARFWPSGGIRLDAYDAPAGAGGFYAKCGFKEVGRVSYRNTPLIYYELLM